MSAPKTPSPKSPSPGAFPPAFHRLLAFPGVGVRPGGSELALVQGFPEFFGPALAELQPWTSRNLMDLAGQGGIESLDDFEQQLFGFAFSCGLGRLARHKGFVPDLLAGNSFGVYAALEYAAVLQPAECLTLLAGAWEAMSACSPPGPAAMAVVLGLEKPAWARLLAGLPDPGSLTLCNVNNPTCLVIGGLHDELERLQEPCLAQGALDFRLLPLDRPYHHPILGASAKDAIIQVAAGLKWRDAGLPLVCTLAGGPDRSWPGPGTLLSTSTEIQDYVCRQLVQGLDWTATLQSVYHRGLKEALDCGVGISLSQNARFLEGRVTWNNTKTLARNWGIHGSP